MALNEGEQSIASAVGGGNPVALPMRSSPEPPARQNFRRRYPGDTRPQSLGQRSLA